MSTLQPQVVKLTRDGTLPSDIRAYLAMNEVAELKAFCLPLEDRGVDFFVYLRRDRNKFLHLTNLSEWLIDFLEQKLYQHCVFHQHPVLANTTKILWQSLPAQSLVRQHLQHIFDIDNIMTYSYCYKDCQEYFCFGSIKNKSKIIDTYINHNDLLQRFILCFKNKYYNMIEKKFKLRVVLPIAGVHKQYAMNKVKPCVQPLHQCLNLKRYYLSDKSMNIYLTRREVEILQHYIEGKTAQQMSAILNMSHRTVEKHLIHIKEKTDCYGSAQLSAKYASIITPSTDKFSGYVPVKEFMVST